MNKNLDIYNKISTEHIDERIAEVFNIEGFSMLSKKEKQRILSKAIKEIIEDKKILLSADDLERLIDQKYKDIFGLGPLEALILDKDITEIMINSADSVFVEKNGILEKTKITFSKSSKIKVLVDRVLNPLGLRLDISSPMVDGRLKDGSRINAVIKPISSEDIVVTIRKFKKDIMGLDDLIKRETLDYKVSEFLKICVDSKQNMVVSGATSTGKTTFLNVLASLVDSKERLITVEDTMELDLNHENIVRLESRPANLEGKGEITLRDLVRNSLRMRPDRIIIGEMRGPEAVDVLQAMNTGHEGSMTSVHANSPKDMISRVETMLLMAGSNLTPVSASKMIRSAIDLVIQLRRSKSGKRIVSRVSHMHGNGTTGEIATSDIFVYDDSECKIRPTCYYDLFFKKIKKKDLVV